MKNKILILLLLLGGIFSFGFTSLQAQAEFIDDKFVISNADFTINEQDTRELFLFFADYVETYQVPYDETFAGYNISEFLQGGLDIDFQADLPSLEYFFFFAYSGIDTVMHIVMTDYEMNDIISVNWNLTYDEVDIMGIASYPFNVVITLPGPSPEPPFTGLINFIKNFLQDLLKSITDMTMDLINNIWDTNLIDINLVILSDTAIYTGTLNDLLYSVLSIFYVIFAITFVWRLLKKLLRKLFSIVRW